jgi:hypothetical protein
LPYVPRGHAEHDDAAAKRNNTFHTTIRIIKLDFIFPLSLQNSLRAVELYQRLFVTYKLYY